MIYCQTFSRSLYIKVTRCGALFLQWLSGWVCMLSALGLGKEVLDIGMGISDLVAR